MKDGNFEIGDYWQKWNASGTKVLQYTVKMRHVGLNEYKELSAPSMELLRHKKDSLYQKWSKQWESHIQTESAKEAIEEINNLLTAALSVHHQIDWNSLKSNDEFTENKPLQPKSKIPKDYLPQPLREVPEFRFIEKIFKSKKRKKIREFDQKYTEAINNWERENRKIDEFNKKIEESYREELRQWEKENEDWEKRKHKFEQRQQADNIEADNFKDKYLKGDNDAILDYCKKVLNDSKYPDSFPQEFQLDYNPNNQILIVEYQLPSINAFPKIKDVKYIIKRDELKENYISQSQLVNMFDDVMYKISLRTIHELFDADMTGLIGAVSFNGWVRSINPATGKEEENCILSIQVKKEEFLEINLASVDPKSCFKMLKGVASSKLSTLTPIQPILQINKSDKRFVNSYEVANELDRGENLAAMDWEDFEHLIRELFEKEFQTNGGEVRVTQASRDGGVDAIAFDPDPIRGGKIVIQAKRYTNTVGVSAVRDLYGTVLNEGATKGILVSTADYGPDAYRFAKGKPLTLLNGSNLLHLLSKHGYHSRINLKEAKRILAKRKIK